MSWAGGNTSARTIPGFLMAATQVPAKSSSLVLTTARMLNREHIHLAGKGIFFIKVQKRGASPSFSSKR